MSTFVENFTDYGRDIEIFPGAYRASEGTV